MAILIPLNKIDPNPYQPREREDPEHVKKIALSIAAQGLMQVPVGRLVDEAGRPEPDLANRSVVSMLDLNGYRVQLAFGHTRLAAYKFMHEQALASAEGLGVKARTSDWFQMPVEIRRLSDLDMFEQGIGENLARKDLTPIEEARAMMRYKSEFGKTSAEIGALFGLSDSAVRNKLRLLDLPEETRALLDQGELSEGTARKLLTLQKMAPARVDALATKLASNGFKDPAAIGDVIVQEIREEVKENKQLYEMWSGKWKPANETPRGGDGLWPLTWAPGEIPELKLADFQKVYQGPQEVDILRPELHGNDYARETYTLKEAYPYLVSVTVPNPCTVARRLAEQLPEAVELIRQLIQPPACTACPLHSAIDGVHYCGLKACWNRKRQTWYDQELGRLTEKLGIPVYDKARDGQYYQDAHHWDSSNPWQDWFDERADHLRLKIDYQSYQPHKFTDSHLVRVVSVREEYQEKKARAKEQERDRDQHWAEERQDQERKHELRQKSIAFLAQVAGPVFAQPLQVLPLGVLEGLLVRGNRQDLPEPRPERIAEAARRVAYAAIEVPMDWSLESQGPVAVAEHLVGVARTWGVELPADWLDQAQRFAE